MEEHVSLILMQLQARPLPLGDCYSSTWEQLKIRDHILWRRFLDEDGISARHQLIVPWFLRDEILEELHVGMVGGHLGEEKTVIASVDASILASTVE